MYFVDGDQGDVEALQGGDHALGHQAFGGEVENAGFAGGHAFPDIDVRISVGSGVDGFGGHTCELEGGDLVLHQGDEGRHHDGEAAACDGRHLVAQRFSRTRWHDGEDVFACQHRINDFLLAGAEAFIAEDVAQHFVRGGKVGVIQSGGFQVSAFEVRTGVEDFQIAGFGEGIAHAVSEVEGGLGVAALAVCIEGEDCRYGDFVGKGKNGYFHPLQKLLQIIADVCGKHVLS